MKILILGGHGFIGRNLKQRLEHEQVDATYYSLSQGWDLRDLFQTKHFIKQIQPDIIFNLASHGGGMQYLRKYPAEIILDNTQMSLNLYNAIHEIVPHAMIINTISNCSYPGELEFLTESEWLNGPVHESVFAYGSSKRHLFSISRSFFEEYGTKSINLIFPNTFGPLDYTDPTRTKALDGMIIRMIQAQKNGKGEFEIWGSGNPIREWLYVSDFVKVLYRAIQMDEAIIYPVNIAQNQGFSIRESANFIAKAMNYKGEITFNTNYPDGALKKIMDNYNFNKLFPNYTFYNHECGIRETVAYYESIL